MPSPYAGLDETQWLDKTKALVKGHPLPADTIRSVVEASWASIFDSRLGTGGFRIWEDILPKPQILGFLLHELIPLELAARFPGVWRRDDAKAEKDLVNLPDPSMSVEVKTSSHGSEVFANRSYAQAQTKTGKNKDGFYLTVNFDVSRRDVRPPLTQIRFGWLDHSDWVAQKAPTGQNARLTPAASKYKLLKL